MRSRTQEVPGNLSHAFPDCLTSPFPQEMAQSWICLSILLFFVGHLMQRKKLLHIYLSFAISELYKNRFVLPIFCICISWIFWGSFKSMQIVTVHSFSWHNILCFKNSGFCFYRHHLASPKLGCELQSRRPHSHLPAQLGWAQLSLLPVKAHGQGSLPSCPFQAAVYCYSPMNQVNWSLQGSRNCNIMTCAYDLCIMERHKKRAAWYVIKYALKNKRYLKNTRG